MRLSLRASSSKPLHSGSVPLWNFAAFSSSAA